MSEYELTYNYTVESIRKKVKNEYPELLQVNDFAIVFEDKQEQELYLCRFYIKQCILKAYPILGDNLLPTIKLVDSEKWDNVAILKSINETAKPTDETDVVNKLRQISLHLHNRLESSVGVQVTGNLFEDTYEKVNEIYGGLDAFPVIINLLSKNVLDEKKISLLNRRQMQQALISNIDAFQQTNKQLEDKNNQLRQLNIALEKAKEEVEKANQSKSMFLNSM